ncbi:MAG: tripartite tricarboxylate transporter substrate binding protein [Lachnospiraceae bacterium]
MFKKVVSLAIAMVLAGSLMACGNSSTSGSAGSADNAAAGNSGSETVADVKWPKTVEIVVPASAGGDTDFNARLFAQILSEKLPATFVVANVNGNGGATGTRQVRDAEPDGSSILFYHSAFVVNEMCGTTDYGFDAYDFAGIAGMNVGNVVTVNASLGINTLQELYDYTKAHPGELKMAAQTGATSYAVAMQLKNAGFDVNIVDAGSAADRLAAVLGGHVDVILAAYGSISDYVQEGTLVPLAMDGEEDLVIADENVNIQTITNQGYDVCLPFYYFFAFPKGTNEALVSQFNDVIEDVVKNNEKYQGQIYESYYQQPVYYRGEEGLQIFDDVYKALETVDFN